MTKLVRQAVARLISIYVLAGLLLYCLSSIMIALTPPEERRTLPEPFDMVMNQSNPSYGVFGLLLVLFAADALAENKKEKNSLSATVQVLGQRGPHGIGRKRVGNKFTMIALNDSRYLHHGSPFEKSLLGCFFLPSGMILLISALENLRPNLPDRLRDPFIASYDASVITYVVLQMFFFRCSLFGLLCP